MKKKLTCLLLSLMVLGTGIAGCGGQSGEEAQSPEQSSVQAASEEVAGTVSEESAAASGETVTIEFAQWWEPELPEGTFRSLMDKFEEQNPGIKVELISGPYSSTQEQLVAGAAAGTMADVVGLDGPWISDFAKQGVIENLTELMESQGYDDSELAAQIQVDGATYMIPVADDFTGERGLHYAAWGLGVSANSEHKEEAWKLIEFLMSEEINGELCTYANAFPGNKNAVPQFSDEMFDIALEMYQTGHLKNEFIGLPMAEDLMRAFDEQLQLMLEGDQDIDTMLTNTQESWSSILAE